MSIEEFKNTEIYKRISNAVKISSVDDDEYPGEGIFCVWVDVGSDEYTDKILAVNIDVDVHKDDLFIYVLCGGDDFLGNVMICRRILDWKDWPNEEFNEMLQTAVRHLERAGRRMNAIEQFQELLGTTGL